MINPTDGSFELTRTCAVDDRTVFVSSVESNSDIYEPASTVWRYSDLDGTPQWMSTHVDSHIETIIPSDSPNDCIVLSSEGEVIFNPLTGLTVERLICAGTWIDGAKGYGRMLSLSRIGDRLIACGNGGQIYFRKDSGNWSLLTKALLFDPEAHARLRRTAPPTTDPGFLQWLTDSRAQKPRNISLHDIAGVSDDAIYICGVEATKPILCFWDGTTLHELKTYLDEAAFTGIYIENPDSVWVCGREGVLLHGSYARGFAPVSLNTQLNLFHMITPYRGKLVMPASVRPGGLYEYDPKTGDFGKFDPPLPRLRSRDDQNSIDGGPFFAQAVGDVLWVVASKDIFRFDGKEWERIDHPDL